MWVMQLILINLEDNHLHVISHDAFGKMGNFNIMLGHNDLVIRDFLDLHVDSFDCNV